MSGSRLEGKTAVVTGASRGIGKAITSALAPHRMNLAITGRSLAGLDQTRQQAETAGSRVLSIEADFSDKGASYRVITETVNSFGGIDILINNAGTALKADVENTSDRDWDRILAVNARSPFILCREALPELKKSEIGTIINISSVVGHKGYEKQAAYSASKHALMGFTKALAREVSKHGIRVHAVSPGGTATDLVTKMRPDIDPAALIQPEEIADVVMYLLLHRGNSVIDEIHLRRENNIPWQ